MPSRHTVLFILAFWLGTTGWLFYRDLWPRLRPGAAPPFTIDLADEAQAPATRWVVFQDGRRLGRATTGVEYDEKSDTFNVRGEFKLWLLSDMRGTANMTFDTSYLVSREGELRHINALGTFILGEEPHRLEGKGHLDGPVKDGSFRPHLWGSLQGAEGARDLDPVPVSARGSVFNPLQPVNRISGLRRGQQWRMPLVDPMQEVISVAGSVFIPFLKTHESATRILQAEVLRDTQTLRLRNQMESEVCLVIEYSGDDLSARTWVREIDGLVLRQEVTKNGLELVLERESR
jgi:hypothetical protein